MCVCVRACVCVVGWNKPAQVLVIMSHRRKAHFHTVWYYFLIFFRLINTCSILSRVVINNQNGECC